MVELRQVRGAFQQIATAGCAWSLLPRNFSPVSTLRCCFQRWRDEGLLAQINRALLAQARHATGRNVHPTGVRLTSAPSRGFAAADVLKGTAKTIDSAEAWARILISGASPAVPR